MDPPVVVALIASFGGIVVALWTAYWTSQQNGKARALQEGLAENQKQWQTALELLKGELSQKATEEKRRYEAKTVLDSYREPLLEAAYDLAERIDNIQHRGFLVYVHESHPKSRAAVLSTLYRFARFFGTLEMLNAGVSFLKFEQAEATKTVAGTLTKIGKTLARDKYDQSRFMIWREEQRAIGELTIYRNGDAALRCIGFATFSQNFDERYSTWFTAFVSDLKSGEAAATSERLARLQSLLADLVRQLDEQGRYVGSAALSWGHDDELGTAD